MTLLILCTLILTAVEWKEAEDCEFRSEDARASVCVCVCLCVCVRACSRVRACMRECGHGWTKESRRGCGTHKKICIHFFWLKLYNFTHRDDSFEVVWYRFYVFCCLFIHVRDGTVHSHNGMNILCILCQGEQSEWSPWTETCTARPVTSRHALCCNSLTWCVTGSCWEAWHSPSSSWDKASGLWSPPYFQTGVCTVLRHQREGTVIASIFSDRCV